MVLIIEACKVTRFLHDCWKSKFSTLFRDFDCTWAQKPPQLHSSSLHNLFLNCIFSLRDSASGSIYFITLFENGGPLLAMDEGFPEKLAHLLYRTVLPNFYTANFICTCRLHTNYEKVHRMGSIQCLPRIMRAWEKMCNFII